MAPRGDRRDSGPGVERGSIMWAGGSCRAWGTRRGSRNPGARSGGGAAATCASAARGWRARAPCGLRRSNPASGPAWMARGQQEAWGRQWRRPGGLCPGTGDGSVLQPLGARWQPRSLTQPSARTPARRPGFPSLSRPLHRGREPESHAPGQRR